MFQTHARLEKQGVCLSHTSMINLLDLMGGHFHDKIVQLVKQGKKFYSVNDNLNCKTTVKNMRVDHRNKQHNWFASIIVFERIDFRHLDNVRPLGDIHNFSNQNYLLSPEEVKKLHSDFKVLVGRVFLEFIKQPQFQAVKKLVPQHILHRYTKEMNTRSDVFPLPVQFKDEKRYADVVDILASHEDTFETILKAASGNEGPERETYIPADFICPPGGDQLTRVRFTSGRKLRPGNHTSKERLEHSHPDVIEMFNTKQAFLTVSQGPLFYVIQEYMCNSK